jgi:hypothetical protein
MTRDDECAAECSTQRPAQCPSSIYTPTTALASAPSITPDEVLNSLRRTKFPTKAFPGAWWRIDKEMTVVGSAPVGYL